MGSFALYLDVTRKGRLKTVHKFLMTMTNQLLKRKFIKGKNVMSFYTFY